MPNLTKAHDELFRRTADECFPSLDAMRAYCTAGRERSTDRWRPPSSLAPHANGSLELDLGEGAAPFKMNDWSFGQLCSFAGVSKDTVNRLSPETAGRVFQETLPRGNKPLQLYTEGPVIRSIHGTAYTRLHNAELLDMLSEVAVDFQPPQKAGAVNTDGTGLYCGEQDLFAFLIDPTGWTEIDDQAFAPGFFVWNSEVGKRSVGVSTFWFQAVCQNHIVWDAIEVAELTRKHTGKVGEVLADIRQLIEGLVAKRDARKDGFAAAVRRAMQTKLGEDADKVMKVLNRNGFGKALAKRALELASEQGRFTIFAVVDALTRIAQESEFAGERNDADQKAGQLLALAA